MTPGERIKILRERRKLTGVALAVRAGLNQSYLSKVERNQAGLSMDGIEAIARVLGVTPGAILDGVLDEGNVPQRPSKGMVPIYDFIQAGSPRGASGAFRDDDIQNYIYAELSDADELFGLMVRGSSMEPEFVDGNVVIFRRGLDPQPGDFVAATSPSRGGAFRRYRDQGTTKEGIQRFALVPLNDNYPTFLSDDDDWKIEGTLVRHVRDFRK